MAARHSPIRRSRRNTYSEETLLNRRYYSDSRRFKKWCEEHGMTPRHYDIAEADDICVLSKSDFHLNDTRSSIVENNGDYFLTPEDYEKWIKETDF